ncbi:MAG: dockerin type I domain-containing protein, partial [Planctomycetota bacterium]
NRRDVNNDGEVSPLDALLIINALNQHGAGSLAEMLPADSQYMPPHAYLDVDGDGFVAPGDVLSVINFMNGANPEGEAVAFVFAAAAEASPTSPLVGASERAAALLEPPAMGRRRLPDAIDLPATAAEFASAKIDDTIGRIAADQQARKEESNSSELEVAIDEILGDWLA